MSGSRSRDERFDLVFCDHGVMGFADPLLTVPEVARVLRPGGLFVFNGTTPWMWVAWGDDEEPASREMRLDYFGLRRADHDDPDWSTTEFQLTYGDWIRLFRANDLEVEDLIELRPDRRCRHDVRRLRAARVGARVPRRAHLEGAEGGGCRRLASGRRPRRSSPWPSSPRRRSGRRRHPQLPTSG